MESPAVAATKAGEATTPEVSAAVARRQRLLAAAILLILAVAGLVLIARSWDDAIQDAPPTPEALSDEDMFGTVPLIDIEKEKMPGAAEYQLQQPRVTASGEYSAAIANAFVAPTVSRSELIAAAKNALIELYDRHGDPTRIRWQEVFVYLEGEDPVKEMAAAHGILNHDMQGFGDQPAGKPWRLTVRLIDREQREALGISDAELAKIMVARKEIGQTLLDLLSKGSEEPSEEILLRETSRKTESVFNYPELVRLMNLHRQLYTDNLAIEWDLR